MKRVISLVLCLCMLSAVISFPAFAGTEEFAEIYAYNMIFRDQNGKKINSIEGAQGVYAELDIGTLSGEYYSATEYTVLFLLIPVFTLIGPKIFNSPYDKENKRFGYFVTNAADPLVKTGVKATLAFNGYNRAQIYERGEARNTLMEGGKLSVELAAGQGVFVIPY